MRLEALSLPLQAEYNQSVTVSFNIQAGAVALGTVAICLYDTDSNICLQSKDLTVYPFGNYPISFSFPMQNKKMNLNISVTDTGIITNCEDVAEFSINIYRPPGQNYGCNKATGQCEPGLGTYSDPNSCQVTCTGGPVICGPTDMSVLGTCIPKQVVFLGFALAALYMVTKG